MRIVIPVTSLALFNSLKTDRAMTQAVSRLFSNAAARVPTQVRSCGICGVQSGTGVGFLRLLRFPLPILVPENVHYAYLILSWCNRPVSDLSTKRSQSHSTLRNQARDLWKRIFDVKFMFLSYI
jgi:hypothetical protein